MCFSDSLEKRMDAYNKTIELGRDDWSYNKIAKDLKVNASTVYDWLFRGKRPDTLYHKPNLDPSPELSYILGVQYGDGWVCKKSTRWYMIALCAKDKDFVESFNKCISKVVGKADGYSIWGKRYYRIEVSNKLLYGFLKKPFEEHKSLIEEFPAQFLRGFFDSEGSVHFKRDKRRKKSWRRHIVACNTNLDLLQYICNLLLRRFFILARLYKDRHPVGSVVNGPNNQLITKRKEMYFLMIMRRNDILHFLKEIGFTIMGKQEKLVAMCDEKKDENPSKQHW